MRSLAYNNFKLLLSHQINFKARMIVNQSWRLSKLLYEVLVHFVLPLLFEVHILCLKETSNLDFRNSFI